MAAWYQRYSLYLVVKVTGNNMLYDNKSHLLEVTFHSNHISQI